MSQYKLSDKVLIDGKWWKVVENWKHKDTLCVENPSRSYDVRPLYILLRNSSFDIVP